MTKAVNAWKRKTQFPGNPARRKGVLKPNKIIRNPLLSAKLMALMKVASTSSAAYTKPIFYNLFVNTLISVY